mmetsp:Transcript_36923/g.61189  ORF Transcript_36923/g.61189 Transcript_36923/m.61189 type:complete len:90 (+) Transcript_36923:55-324(+)
MLKCLTLQHCYSLHTFGSAMKSVPKCPMPLLSMPRSDAADGVLRAPVEMLETHEYLACMRNKLCIAASLVRCHRWCVQVATLRPKENCS